MFVDMEPQLGGMRGTWEQQDGVRWEVGDAHRWHLHVDTQDLGSTRPLGTLQVQKCQEG